MSTNPFELFQVDLQKENEDGIWAEYPVPNRPDRGFKIRFVHSGETNISYRDALRARLKPLNYRIQQDMLSDEEFEDIQKKVFADKIVKGWESKNEQGRYVEGIYGSDFEIVEFNKTNVYDVFVKAPRLFKDIKRQADSFATFKNIEIEVDLKN